MEKFNVMVHHVTSEPFGCFQSTNAGEAYLFRFTFKAIEADGEAWVAF